MKATLQRLLNRRTFCKTAAGTGAFIAANSLVTNSDLEAISGTVNTNSQPSDLKITDMRIAHVVGAPMRCPLIKLYTNQGLVGLGEVRDGASKKYALMLKSRILGRNPCRVDQLFRRIKQFGWHARQAGGVCGVEMALWDLAGKAYGVPAYQMLGGKFRDRVRLYADTTMSPDPVEYGRRMKERLDMGYTFLKMDLGSRLVARIPGTITRPLGSMPSRNFSRRRRQGQGNQLSEAERRERRRRFRRRSSSSNTMHMFTGIELTPKGIDLMAEYVAVVREQIGMEVPLSADHFGHIGVNSCIRLGKALEKYNMAWLEDMVPWQFPELMKKITDEVDIPILTGEDIYLKEPFQEMVDMKAVDIIHPDLASSGGLLETKKIGDLAMEGGVAMAMHFAGTPVSFMANVHCAAATDNFLALENHSVDVPWWDDMVSGPAKPLIKDGFAAVPEGPGLGVELVDDVVKEHLNEADPGYFEPTPEWDELDSHDRLWSFNPPKKYSKGVDKLFDV